jgi:D-alanine-D-alanine ligase
MKNLLLIFGGGSSEHKISEITCGYLEQQIDKTKFNIFKVEMVKDSLWTYDGDEVVLNFDRTLSSKTQTIAKMDIALPCIHGYPAETGDIQSYFSLINLPFFGVNSEASKICFNKVLTKAWLEKSGYPTAPFIFVKDQSKESLKRANEFLSKHNHIFVKASNQGSSVGCYSVKTSLDLETSLTEAFKFSDYVLIEAFINGRELEVSTFEYKNELHATDPGEIVCPTEFYNFEQKYDKGSMTEIHISAPDIQEQTKAAIKNMAKEIFRNFNLKDLSRIDFFLTPGNEILINEINTFPGMTPISLFPQMIEHSGIEFCDYINERLLNI